MSHERSDLITRLQEATADLTFQSETDQPVEPFLLENAGTEPVTPARVLQLFGHPPDAPVQTVPVDRFFQAATREEAWHNEEEREVVHRFRRLLQVLDQILVEANAYRVGEVEIDVYVVGRTRSGDLAGVKTRVVET